jgi:hypothetical protein
MELINHCVLRLLEGRMPMTKTDSVGIGTLFLTVLAYLLTTRPLYLCPQAVFVDPDGTVLYGSDCSIGLLTTDNTLVLPPDGDGLANMAVQELVEHTLEVCCVCECSGVGWTIERVCGGGGGLNRVFSRT